MHIERPVRRSSLNPTYIACGCLTVLIGGGILLVIVSIFFLPGIVLQLSGFQARGNTNELFSDITQAPTVEITNLQPTPAQVVIELGAYGTEPLNTNLYDYSLTTGSSASGQQVAVVSFDEPGLQEICRQRSTICGPGNSTFRNARVDLRPGGAVVYGEVFVPQVGIWQNVGVVMQLTGNHRIVVAGVDVGGALYSAPPNEFSGTIDEVERVANEVLQQLVLDAGGARYNLSQVQIDDSTLTLILR